MAQLTSEFSWAFLRKLNILLPYDLVIPGRMDKANLR